MKQFFVAALFSLGLATNTFGASITLITTKGEFHDPTNNGLGPAVGLPFIVNGIPTSKISWGADMPPGPPPGEQSSYEFTGINVPGPIDVTPPADTGFFLLGNFKHNNFIVDSPILETVKLDIILNFFIDGNAAPQNSFTYTLTHLETDNATETAPFTKCPLVLTPVGELCTDQVTISAPALQSFTVGGIQYFLELEFRVGGIPVPSFITKEGEANPAEIFGRFTATRPRSVEDVPEPATFALMGAGLLGLALATKRRKA